MSTKSFVSIIVAALLAFVLVVSSVAFAIAEGSFVDSVVVNFKEVDTNNFLIEVFDEEGNLWSYFADAEDARIGNQVKLTIVDDKVVDAEIVGFLSTLEMLQWILR